MKFNRMLTALSLLLVLVATSAVAKDKEDMTATLKAKEMAINDAFKAKDTAKFMSIVEADAWMADMSGFMNVSQMGEMMKECDVRSYTIDNYKTYMIDKDAYISTYNFTGDASYKGQAMPAGPFYCSTVWAKRGKDWKAVYHQETLGMQPGAMPAPAATESH